MKGGGGRISLNRELAPKLRIKNAGRRRILHPISPGNKICRSEGMKKEIA